MITLHRLNGEEFHLNAQQVESLDASPDTRITLVNGKQLYVREKPDDVRRLMLAWFRLVHAPLPERAMKGAG